jgi:hypothetical protein
VAIFYKVTLQFQIKEFLTNSEFSWFVLIREKAVSELAPAKFKLDNSLYQFAYLAGASSLTAFSRIKTNQENSEFVRNSFI